MAIEVHTRELSIISFNMHGFNQGCIVIEDLIVKYNPNIILIQEHWLTPTNLIKLDKFIGYVAYGCSAMSDAVESGLLRGRPFGGVSILINKNIRQLCEILNCSERFAIVKVANYIIVNVYLPCIGTVDRLHVCDDIFNEIGATLSQYQDCEYIIAGDFNVDLDHSDTVSHIVNNFCHANSFVRCDILSGTPKCNTYSNLALNHHSTIDYMLTTSADNFIHFEVLDPDINFSDHLPIMCSVEIAVTKASGSTHSNFVHNLHEPIQLRWDRADLISYYQLTGEQLKPILASIEALCGRYEFSDKPKNCTAFVDHVYGSIVDIMVMCANQFVPHCRRNFFKFWWDEEMDLLKEASIESDRIWKDAGKPKQGPIFIKRQSCRLQYRNRIRENLKEELTSYSNDLHDALLAKNGTTFWKIWRSKFKCKNKPLDVEGSSDANIIVDKFANFFPSAVLLIMLLKPRSYARIS